MNKVISLAVRDATLRDQLMHTFEKRSFGIRLLALSGTCEELISQPPELLVCDDALLGSDGARLVVRLRREGLKIPIVFVSQSWCDPKTFSWLRDILEVEMVVTAEFARTLLFEASLESLFNRILLRERARSDQEKHETSQTPAATGSETKIEQVKRRLRDKLALEWQTLQDLLDSDASSSNLKKASSIVHQIRGTAGSLGLKRVGDCAVKIDDCLRFFKPDTVDERDLWWDKIHQYLTLGAGSFDWIEPESESSEPFGQDNNGPLVVVVSDLSEWTERIRRVLRAMNLRNARFPDPIEIFDLIEERRPDLIVIDADLLGISAYEICERIRAHKHWREIPVLFLSSRDDTAGELSDQIKELNKAEADNAKSFELLFELTVASLLPGQS